MKVLLIILLGFTFVFSSYVSNVRADVQTDLERENAVKAARVAEKNGIADMLCKVINLATGEIGRGIFAFIIAVVGIGVLQGKVSLGLFIGILVAILMYFLAGLLLGILANSDPMRSGCQCLSSVPFAKYTDSNGNVVVVEQEIYLDPKCKETRYAS